MTNIFAAILILLGLLVFCGICAGILFCWHVMLAFDAVEANWRRIKRGTP